MANGEDVYVFDPAQGVEQLDPTTPKIDHKASRVASALRQIARYLNSTAENSLNKKLQSLDDKVNALVGWSPNQNSVIPLKANVTAAPGVFYRDSSFNLFYYGPNLEEIPVYVTTTFRPYARYFADPPEYTIERNQSQWWNYTEPSSMQPKGVIASFMAADWRAWGSNQLNTIGTYSSGNVTMSVLTQWVPCKVPGTTNQLAFQMIVGDSFPMPDGAGTYEVYRMRVRIVGVYY